MLKKKNALSVALFLLALSATVSAQNAKGIITGRVVDSVNAVLQGARIRVEPGGIVATSDGQGQFIVTNLSPGTYTVTASFVGFANFSAIVEISGGQTANLDAVMKVASTNEQIEVTAPDVTGDAEAINRTRTSPNILDVLTNPQIMSLPNFTIADAVGRLPGVSLERDEGDGKYVEVRGTEPRLTNTTIDGINVPSPEAGVRQVKLDVIPSDLVESVEVDKTLSANQDGDAIGGTVNLVIRSAGEQPYISAFGQLGYTPIENGRHANQFGITASNRFLASKKLGILGNYTYDYNGRGIDDIEPANDTGTLTPSYDSIDLREYQYYRTRWGATASVDYKLREGSNIYAHGLYSDFKDYGNRWDYNLTNTVNPASTSSGDPATYTGGLPTFGVSKRLPDYTISTFAVGGKHLFTNSWLSWEASFARASQSAAAGNPGANFTYDVNGSQDQNDPLYTFAINNCAYNPVANKSVYRPQWQAACTAQGSPTYTPSNWNLTEVDTTTGNTPQINLQAQASYAFNYHAGSHFSTFEFGFKERNAHKGQYAFSPAYTGVGPTMDTLLSNFTNTRYYGGSYQLGPFADYDKVIAWFNANPGVLTEDVGLTHLNSDASNFNYHENVAAGYAMNTVELGKFRLQTGLRLEATNLNATGYIVTNDADGNYVSTTQNNQTQSYIDALPSVQLKYAWKSNIDFRAVYSRGMSRPDPQDIIPSVTVDQSTNPYTYSLGNPALVAEHSNNYDLLYEQYLNPLGLFQLGVFYKSLSSPIIQTTTFPTTGQYAGYKISEYKNAGSAWVDGMEISYQQRWSSLPGVLGGLGFFGNYTFTNSEAFGTDPLRVYSIPKLLRQSPNTWNVWPSYERGPLSINMGITYNGSNINSYQYEDSTLNADGSITPNNPAPILGPFGPSGDNYFYTHVQIDTQISYRLPKGFSAYFSGQNMNNQVFGFYNGSTNYVNQREYYKPTYFGGLRWNSNHE